MGTGVDQSGGRAQCLCPCQQLTLPLLSPSLALLRQMAHSGTFSPDGERLASFVLSLSLFIVDFLFAKTGEHFGNTEDFSGGRLQGEASAC